MATDLRKPARLLVGGHMDEAPIHIHQELDFYVYL